MFAFGRYFVVIIYVMGTILAYVRIDPKLKETFFKYIVKEHNKYRKIHRSKPLAFNYLCSRIADEVLREMLSEPFSKDYYKICGVNKYLTDHITISELNARLAKKIVAFWYEKGADYNYLAEPNNNDADAFTQLVWKNSSQLGLQMLMTTKGKLYVAATYFAKGNIEGTYLENVKKPEKPTVKKAFGNLFKGLN